MSLTPRLDKLEAGNNIIINGGFDFWQRGTSFALSANGVYHADRWRNLRVTSGTHTLSRDTDVPTVAQSGFRSQFSLKYTQTVAMTTGQNAIVHKIEGTDYARIHGKKVRLSFWVKASIAGTYSVCFSNDSTTLNYITDYTINTANTWEKKTCDIPLLSSDTGWTFDNSASAVLFWNTGNTTTAGTPGVWQATSIHSGNEVDLSLTLNATFFLAQVSLQAFDYTLSPGADIPFERAGKTAGQELAMCQRYYEKSYELSTAPGSNATTGRQVWTDTVQNATTTYGSGKVEFVTKKRGTPTITVYPTDGSPSGSIQYGLSATEAVATLYEICERNFGVYLNGTAAGLTVNNAVQLVCHWVADAEL